MSEFSTLIVGAGPTGMTATIELKRAGLDVRIIDKSDHMAEHSQALVVQAEDAGAVSALRHRLRGCSAGTQAAGRSIL